MLLKKARKPLSGGGAVVGLGVLLSTVGRIVTFDEVLVGLVETLVEVWPCWPELLKEISTAGLEELVVASIAVLVVEKGA